MQRFVVCISNRGCDDLELRKLYPVVSEEQRGEEGYLRVVDESGGDYLYPAKNFAAVELSEDAVAALQTV
jgi:hypothetical protein